MHDNKPDQFVDELLDASLKRYGGEEARAGLEMRLLAGVRSRQDATRRRRVVLALAVCAGIVAAVGFLLHSSRVPSRQPVTTASATQQTTKPLASPGSTDSRSRSSRLVHVPKETPRTAKPAVLATKRPEQFPSPSPLTEQEKLLMVFLDKGVKLDGVAEANMTGDVVSTDMKIPGVVIAPLEITPIDESQSEQGK